MFNIFKKKKLSELKRELYSALLKLKTPTDSEINIMYELSQDKGIQALLSK